MYRKVLIFIGESDRRNSRGRTLHGDPDVTIAYGVLADAIWSNYVLKRGSSVTIPGRCDLVGPVRHRVQRTTTQHPTGSELRNVLGAFNDDRNIGHKLVRASERVRSSWETGGVVHVNDYGEGSGLRVQEAVQSTGSGDANRGYYDQKNGDCKITCRVALFLHAESTLTHGPVLWGYRC